MMRNALVALVLLGTPALAQPTLNNGRISFAADFAAAPNQFIRTDGSLDGLNVDICGEVVRCLGIDVE